MAVVRNASRHRFEIVDAPAAFLLYAQQGPRIRLIHTEVPPELRGKGYAPELARAALDYARHERLQVEPDCPFVAAYIARHPESSSLVAPPGGHDHTVEEERRSREAALDETLAESFPASDPLSTDPNPYDDEPTEKKASS